MHYPLTLSFKIVALAPQLAVRDAHGHLLLYVKQKLFKLKEAVTVFADEAQTQPRFTIQADRVLDLSARYHISDMAGHPLGAVQRHGLRSLWKAHYDILVGERPILTIREANPWVKVLDGLLGEVPFLGLLSGYLFHPAYVIARPDGTPVLRLTKQPALFESTFQLEQQVSLAPAEEHVALLGVLMMLLLERSRG